MGFPEGHINDEWIGKVNELKTRLQRGKEIAEQINILGDVYKRQLFIQDMIVFSLWTGKVFLRLETPVPRLEILVSPYGN